MEFASRRYAEVVVASANGRIDHAGAEPFKSALQPLIDQCVEGSDRVVLDFSGVEYISSVGLRVLMLAAKQVKAQKGTIVIAAMQPVVKEIFDISRFNYVYAAFPTVRDAVGDLSTQALALFEAA
ncbi:MAG: STAS domain-containing protein [Burkholderiales bacterium]|nr:STAS domain-containing protein [Burkholderiales bacterium]